MSRLKVGPIGRVVSDRPLLITLVAAFGLTAAALIGVVEESATALVSNLIIAALACVTAPMLISAVSPVAARARAGISIVALVLAASAYFLSRDSLGGKLSPANFAIPTSAVLFYLWFRPLIGAAARLAFAATAAAALGMAGGLGLYYLADQQYLMTALFAAFLFSIGAIVGINLFGDYVSFFTKGADLQKSAGIAARFAIAPAFFAVATSAGVALIAFIYDSTTNISLGLVAYSASAALLAAVSGVVFNSSIAALLKPSENIAVEENLRRQAFRARWRPLRRFFSPSAAYAGIAMLGVLLIVLLFELNADIQYEQLILSGILSVIAALIFVSFRTGLFMVVSLAASGILVEWVWSLLGKIQTSPSENFIVTGISAMLYALLALSWRDARSPWLNARETTEAGLAEGIARYLAASAACIFVMSTLILIDVPNATSVMMRLVAHILIGLLISPFLMTALTEAGRRRGNL